MRVVVHCQSSSTNGVGYCPGTPAQVQYQTSSKNGCSTKGIRYCTGVAAAARSRVNKSYSCRKVRGKSRKEKTLICFIT